MLDFQDNLIKEIGLRAVDKMKTSRHESWKLDRHWYEEKIAFYNQEVDNLEK